MKTLGEKSDQEESKSAAESSMQENNVCGSMCNFTDNRPETAIQKKLQNTIRTSSKFNPALVQNYATAKSTPATKSVSSNRAPMQMAVSASAVYALNQGRAAVTTLDGRIAAAETAASNFVQNINLPNGYSHTPHQAAYMANATARGWGNCVEEQLNPVAIGLGWSTQNLGHGSNPDYSATISGKKVWADLTTAHESQGSGAHVTGKLVTKARNGAPNSNNWEAADVTHANTNPLSGAVAPQPIPNGNVTNTHRAAYQRYRAYQNGDDWDRARDQVVARYGRFSFGVYTQTWSQRDRSTFSTAVGRAGF